MKVLSFLGAVGMGIFVASWLARSQRKGVAGQGTRSASDVSGRSVGPSNRGASNRRASNRGAANKGAANRGALNINEASEQEMMRVLGLDAETAERIVEHRPYPSRIDLLGRMVVPNDVYETIKDKIVYRAS